MKPHIAAIVFCFAVTGDASAQTGPSTGAPAQPVKATRATAKQPAAAFDPYEKARKSQAEFFRREAENDAKRREKEAGETRFYKKRPGPAPAGASGLSVPMGRF